MPSTASTRVGGHRIIQITRVQVVVWCAPFNLIFFFVSSVNVKSISLSIISNVRVLEISRPPGHSRILCPRRGRAAKYSRSTFKTMLCRAIIITIIMTNERINTFNVIWIKNQVKRRCNRCVRVYAVHAIHRLICVRFYFSKLLHKETRRNCRGKNRSRSVWCWWLFFQTFSITTMFKGTFIIRNFLTTIKIMYNCIGLEIFNFCQSTIVHYTFVHFNITYLLLDLARVWNRFIFVAYPIYEYWTLTLKLLCFS